MDSTTKMIVVGRLGSPYGIRGWLKLFSYTEPADNILDYPHWFIETKSGWQPVELEEVQSDPEARHIRVKLVGSDTPEDAGGYTNALVAVTRDQLPDLAPGDYYWSDLEGLTVVNTVGVTLGQVDHILSTGANDVLVIKGERERLVPYITDVVLQIDLVKKQMLVAWDAEF